MKTMALKGLGHEMNLFLKAYNNQQVLSVSALIVFTIFCLFKDTKAATLTLRMHTGSRL